MTASELLVLLGRAWSRLLLYPGGLAAFTTAWLIFSLTSKREPRTKNREPAKRTGSRFLVLGSIVPPWLALALLPLPLAVALPRQIDIVVVFALLEWPRILAIRQELQADDIRNLAAALNGYPPLILATLALAQSAGSLEIAALARAPGDLASASASALHWLGAVALALALPPVLGIGPFATSLSRTRHQEPSVNFQTFKPSNLQTYTAGALALGLRLRTLGLIALAALPWSGSQDDSSWALLRTLAAASLIAALLWCYDRLTCRQRARRWARVYLALDAALLLALIWAAYQALQSRLA